MAEKKAAKKATKTANPAAKKAAARPGPRADKADGEAAVLAKIEPIATPAALEEVRQKLPGILDALEPDHSGMHTTDSVDFDVVVFGEVVLELDDGAEVVLKAGDCVIQNGTRHAWHNR